MILCRKNGGIGIGEKKSKLDMVTLVMIVVGGA